MSIRLTWSWYGQDVFPQWRGADGRFAKPEQAKGAGRKKAKPRGNKKKMPPAELRAKKPGLKKRAGAK